MNRTKIKFYVESDGEILAVFINKLEAMRSTELECYSHNEQHTWCDIGYVRSCRLAKKSQYKDLERELIAAGYELIVLNENYKHLQE